jgi:RNA polymerase sigma-70 factor (ECF subfamily)
MNGPNADEQDAQDMARLANGRDSALNDLMGRHAERLFHYLVRSLQNESEAADLAQEAFVRVYQNRVRFDPRQKFDTWLYAIASNLVRDRYRWRSRHPQVSLEAENEQTEATLKDTLRALDLPPDHQLQNQECSAAVSRAVAALPEELREPLILSVYQEMSHAEIAAILKCSAKAVEMRIYRARQQLRESLRELLETR